MLRFLLRPRWIVFGLIVIGVAVLFVRLGFWQLDRLDQRRDTNAVITQARTHEPVPVGDLLTADSAAKSSVSYRKITATGQYDAEHQFLVRNRTVDDRVGFFLLTPLRTDAGTLFVVRGWIAPGAEAASAPQVPAPPAGDVTVTARLRLSESEKGSKTQLGAYSAITRINTSELAESTEAPTYRAYAELVEQSPTADPAIALISEPPLDEGPHLSYAVQWFLFAGIGVGGFFVLAWRAAREKDEPSPTLAHTEEKEPVNS
ncbi:MAG: SURF1 family protein [Corynebacteriales bacterium]|nr:SURF1 family protein [Mycobacteriales bacterium]